MIVEKAMDFQNASTIVLMIFFRGLSFCLQAGLLS
jgi:hypothetical protein